MNGCLKRVLLLMLMHLKYLLKPQKDLYILLITENLVLLNLIWLIFQSIEC